MAEKTNYAQSLMHVIKGNLGTGILAMPASFAHAGLINSVIGLPILCLIATYCVHLLIKSSQQLERKSIGANFTYASLAKRSFESGPNRIRSLSNLICSIVDGTLLVAQIGVCCVYIVFVVDNLISIMASYNVHVDKNLLFVAVYPVALMLSFIRSLKRLAIASGLANILEMVGITIVLQYLFRSLDKVDMGQRDKFMPLDQVALGFGSAMFAFEGISVILPVYTRMKNPNRMSGCWGVINMSFALLCLLYFMVGLFGFLIFGRNAGDSITLNLPSEPLYDLVRASFTIAVFLTYPLQFYVPNEIIWNWAKNNLIKADPKPAIGREGQNEAPTPAIRIIDCDDHEEAEPETNGTAQDPQTRIESSNRDEQNQTQEPPGDNQSRLEYLCRAIIVTFTFAVAISVPKLNLLMDLIGSITGTILSLILPAIIHLAACWEDSSGYNRLGMLLVNSLIIVVGLTAGSCSFTSSLVSIVNSF